MYVRIDEKTKQITQIQLAPFRQGVADEQLYHCLDPHPVKRPKPASVTKRQTAVEQSANPSDLQDEKSAYIERLRGEFRRLEALVTQARTVEDLQAIDPGFPLATAQSR